MKDLRTIYAFIFFSVGIFLLGAYTSSVRFDCKEVTGWQWASTSLWTFFFLMLFVTGVRLEKTNRL